MRFRSFIPFVLLLGMIACADAATPTLTASPTFAPPAATATPTVAPAATRQAQGEGRYLEDFENKVYLNPTYDAYDGPVVLLMDATSTSASEVFAAGLQAIGRAVVVGEHSPGSCLAADLARLSNGATFIYPTVQAVAPDGTVIEGNSISAFPSASSILEKPRVQPACNTGLDKFCCRI